MLNSRCALFLWMLACASTFVVNGFRPAPTPTRISRRWYNGRDPRSNQIDKLEKDVVATAKAQMDMRRIVQGLEKDDASPEIPGVSSPSTVVAPQWKIAVAAASTSALFFYIAVVSNLFLSAVVWAGIFYVASSDPLDERDDSVAGPLARMVGRKTLLSVKASSPKLKAIARAALVEDADIPLSPRSRMEQLEQENQALRRWKFRRQWVDDNVASFSPENLKQSARMHKLPVGGTKAQLLMRLVEAGIYQINEEVVG